ESRTKEIGIRKVLGASVQNLVGMVSREFLIVVFFSGIVALPAAWYLMTAWLEDFAYKVSMGIGIFMIAALIALAIAFATISFRALRAARANPVESLRSE
ncbi:MAG TPA: FtsX-like permease family protein, partial [Cyclobacteriaceae bacterium]|nr:FtsX-like permease family protein [Cyclobacteriaceae bacterium]